MVSAGSFTYNGTSSTAYGLAIGSFNADTVEESEFFHIDFNQPKGAMRGKFAHGGFTTSEAPPIDFTVISKQEITNTNRENIIQWLLAKSEYKALSFQDSSLSGYTYYAVFTNVVPVYVNGVLHGFNLHGVLNSDFCIGTSVTISGTGNGTKTLTNNSLIGDAYVYPVVTFSGASFSVKNTTDDANRIMSFSGIASGTTTVDCENRVVTNSAGNVFGCFNDKGWLRLRPGANTLVITAAGSYAITCPTYKRVGI